MPLCFNLWCEASEISRGLLWKQQFLGAGEGEECDAGAPAGRDVWQEAWQPCLSWAHWALRDCLVLFMLSQRNRPGGCD